MLQISEANVLEFTQPAGVGAREHQILVSTEILKAQQQVTAYMHRMCNHKQGTRILIKTILHTHGMTFNGTTIRPGAILPKHHCDACRLSKPAVKPLKRQGGAMPMLQFESLEDDLAANNNRQQPATGDYEHIVSDGEIANDGGYTPTKKGGRVATPPRFDMAALRPGELIFVDLKPYPVQVRGGWWGCLLAVDSRTNRTTKVDVRVKYAAGQALRQILVQWGVHKNPYRCTVISDGCGAMVHVEAMSYAMGINWAPLPVDTQSLNLAETAIKVIFDAARTTITGAHGAIPDTYYAYIVSGVITHHNNTAGTSTRSYMPPITIWQHPNNESPPTLDAPQLLPLGTIVVQRKKRDSKFMSEKQLPATIRMTGSGDVTITTTTDPPLRGSTVVHIGYARDTLLSQKFCRKIANNLSEAVICTRNWRRAQQDSDYITLLKPARASDALSLIHI